MRLESRSIDRKYTINLKPVYELKINCLKYLSLNIVSFLEQNSFMHESLLKLPIYLIRDLQNFIKVGKVIKYEADSMKVVEKAYNDEEKEKLEVQNH